MSFLSPAPPLESLSLSHGAFQEHAAHLAEWSATLSSKGSPGTCIPDGVTTFVHAAFTAHVGYIPAYAHENDVLGKMGPFEADRHRRCPSLCTLSHRGRAYPKSTQMKIATQPNLRHNPRRRVVARPDAAPDREPAACPRDKCPYGDRRSSRYAEHSYPPHSGGQGGHPEW